MKRPLLLVCLAVVCIMAVYFTLFPPALPDFCGMAGAKITVRGRIYQKEFRTSYRGRQLLLYLSDVEILTSSVDTSHYPSSSNILCYLSVPEKMPRLGSTVYLTGKGAPFRAARNPGNFDARMYYASLDLDMGLQDCIILGEEERYSWPGEVLWQIRNILGTNLEANLGSREGGILKNILLGDKEALDEEIKDLYKRNGIVHILAISGLHISILGMGLYRRLRKWGVPVSISAFAGTVVILLYGIMAGGGVSLYRAVGMFFIHMLAEVLGRTYDRMTAWGVMFTSMLLRQPLYLYHSGFWLSFISILGIACIYPIFGRSEREALRYRQGKEKKLHSFWEGIRRSLCMGCSIGLATLPVQLWYFYEIPVYGTLLNLLVLPLMGSLLGMGIFLSLLSGGWIAGVLSLGVHGIFTLYESLCLFSEKWPGHTWIPGKPALIQVIIYVVFVMAAAAGKKRINIIFRRSLLLAALIVLGLRIPAGFSVDFLDVGQGEAICIRNQRKVYLVDAGSTSNLKAGKYTILPFLKHEGIGRIDAIFITHGDADHYNGLAELLEGGIFVGKIILPNVGESLRTESYKEIEEIGKAFSVPVYDMAAGSSWREGNLDFLCLHPGKGFSGPDANEGSLVLHLSYHNFSMLLTGDIGGEAEILLTEELKKRQIRKVSLLKVAHHGSKYSTSQEFLDAVSFGTGVISCGAGNRYGHPHEELVERLEKAGILIYRTEDTGAIRIEVKKGKVTAKTFLSP